MIEPHMATMLAFIATDARLSATAVDAALRGAVDESFNCVTVDSDTSTNDSCVLCATARAGNRDIEPDDADFPLIAGAIREVCIELAPAVVRDGEGATRFIPFKDSEPTSRAAARQLAYALPNSPLVKTARVAGQVR